MADNYYNDPNTPQNDNPQGQPEGQPGQFNAQQPENYAQDAYNTQNGQPQQPPYEVQPQPVQYVEEGYYPQNDASQQQYAEPGYYSNTEPAQQAYIQQQHNDIQPQAYAQNNLTGQQFEQQTYNQPQQAYPDTQGQQQVYYEAPGTPPQVAGQEIYYEAPQDQDDAQTVIYEAPYEQPEQPQPNYQTQNTEYIQQPVNNPPQQQNYQAQNVNYIQQPAPPPTPNIQQPGQAQDYNAMHPAQQAAFAAQQQQQAQAAQKQTQSATFDVMQPRQINQGDVSAAELTKAPHAYELEIPPAPRKISFSLLTHNLFSSKAFVQGALLTFLGMGVMLFQLPLTDFSSSKFTPENIAVTRGRVIAVRQLNVGVDRLSPIRVTYSYIAGPFSKIFTVNSYCDEEDYAKGDEVSIEYLKDNPGFSRVVGGMRNVFEPWILLTTLPFLLAGLIPLFIALRHGIKINRFLKKGALSYGTIKVFTKHIMDFKFLLTYQFLATFSTPKGIRGAELFALKTPNIDPQYSYPVLYIIEEHNTALLLDGKSIPISVTKSNKITSSLISKFYLQLILPAMLALFLLFSCYLWITFDFQAAVPLNKRYIPIERDQHEYVPKPPPKVKKLKNTPPPPLRL